MSPQCCAPTTPEPFREQQRSSTHRHKLPPPSCAGRPDRLPKPHTEHPEACSPTAGSVSASQCLGLKGFVFRVKARSSAPPSPTPADLHLLYRQPDPVLTQRKALVWHSQPGHACKHEFSLLATRLEFCGSQTQGWVCTYCQISAKEHAEPASCQERFQSVLKKLFMIQEPQSWASERGSSRERREGPGEAAPAPRRSSLRMQGEAWEGGRVSLIFPKPCRRLPQSPACSLLQPNPVL